MYVRRGHAAVMALVMVAGACALPPRDRLAPAPSPVAEGPPADSSAPPAPPEGGAIAGDSLSAPAGDRSGAAPAAELPSSVLSADAPLRTSSSGPFLVQGRGFGTDAYGGPIDVLLNRGLVVAQWQNNDRHIFEHDFAWQSVWASVRNPGPAIEAEGGWFKVFKRHLLPFGGDEIREGQWVPNYFGHVLEGGLAYRRLLEWNRAHGVPFPTLFSIVTTQAAVWINEAYETPGDDPWVSKHGTAGTFMDFVVFDPLGMLLFHQDGVSRFFAEKLGAQLWPTQAAIVIPDGIVINNGKSAIYRPKLWFTDRARFFLRTGLGLEMGLSFPRADGYEVAVGAGFQSTRRYLDPVTHIEKAEFAGSAGLWIDRDGALLFALTVDQRTDRLLGVNLFPGVVRLFGHSPGLWFVLDSEHRAFFGFTTHHSLGLGLGVGT